jgi:uncharacterized protein YciI
MARFRPAVIAGAQGKVLMQTHAPARPTEPGGSLPRVARFILFYDYVDNMAERRVPHREAHLARLQEWKADGRIMLAGALGNPPHGAAIVFDVDDPQEIERFADEDPYTLAELVTARRVEPWTLV